MNVHEDKDGFYVATFVVNTLHPWFDFRAMSRNPNAALAYLYREASDWYMKEAKAHPDPIPYDKSGSGCG